MMMPLQCSTFISVFRCIGYYSFCKHFSLDSKKGYGMTIEGLSLIRNRLQKKGTHAKRVPFFSDITSSPETYGAVVPGLVLSPPCSRRTCCRILRSV